MISKFCTIYKKIFCTFLKIVLSPGSSAPVPLTKPTPLNIIRLAEIFVNGGYQLAKRFIAYLKRTVESRASDLSLPKISMSCLPMRRNSFLHIQIQRLQAWPLPKISKDWLAMSFLLRWSDSAPIVVRPSLRPKEQILRLRNSPSMSPCCLLICNDFYGYSDSYASLLHTPKNCRYSSQCEIIFAYSD